MIRTFDDPFEQALLDKYANLMATNLLTYAKNHNVELHGLLDAGWKWQEWLDAQFGDGGIARTTHFMGMAIPYAERFASSDTDEWHARCWHIAQHAIHLIGQQLYTTHQLSWRLIWQDGSESWYRTLPVVQEYDSILLTVYYVIQTGEADQNQYYATLYALCVEHLTEADWHTWADQAHPSQDPGQPPNDTYDIGDLLFDVASEGHGAIIKEFDSIVGTEELLADTKAAAEYAQTHFAETMDGLQLNQVPRLHSIRPPNDELAVIELPEQRARFGNDKNAINRHSVRVYQCRKHLYQLDQSMEVEPRYYTLYEMPAKPRPGQVAFGRTIKVGGQEYWGDGLSWPKAEELAKQAILDEFYTGRVS